MRFEQALEAMRAGKFVRCVNWSNENYMLYLERDSDGSSNIFGTEEYSTESTERKEFHWELPDILAKDWVIVEQPEVIWARMYTNIEYDDNNINVYCVMSVNEPTDVSASTCKWVGNWQKVP